MATVGPLPASAATLLGSQGSAAHRQGDLGEGAESVVGKTETQGDKR